MKENLVLLDILYSNAIFHTFISGKLKPLRIGPYKRLDNFSDVTFEHLAQDDSTFHTHRNQKRPFNTLIFVSSCIFRTPFNMAFKNPLKIQSRNRLRSTQRTHFPIIHLHKKTSLYRHLYSSNPIFQDNSSSNDSLFQSFTKFHHSIPSFGKRQHYQNDIQIHHSPTNRQTETQYTLRRQLQKECRLFIPQSKVSDS